MKEVLVYGCRPAFVDDENFDRASKFSWRFNWRTGYVQTNLKRRFDGSRPSVTLHRLVMNVPKGIECDHRDRDKFNCQKSNLRFTDHAGNMQNRAKRRAKCLSKFKGVTFATSRQLSKPWKAGINLDGKWKHLRYCSTEEEAANVYNDAAKKYFGDYALLNIL